jgi:uncharacterized Zn finger protein (UPF0148 family)
MDRTVQYNKDSVCDICGAKGAFDYMGDCICPKCLDEDEKEKEKTIERKH